MEGGSAFHPAAPAGPLVSLGLISVRFSHAPDSSVKVLAEPSRGWFTVV